MKVKNSKIFLKMENQKYIVYIGKPGNISLADRQLDKDYTLKIWKPKIYSLAPKGITNISFFLECFSWWLFHYFSIFTNSHYSIFVIYHNESGELAHYSVVAPKYFKTPFIEKNDLQIGPVGTFENHRRKGLASFVIQEIFKFYKKENPNFWYIVRAENEESSRLIEKMGFKAYGEGV